jgi:hypothetical protein
MSKPKFKIVPCEVQDEDGYTAIIPLACGETFAVYEGSELLELFRTRTEAEQCVRDCREDVAMRS